MFTCDGKESCENKVDTGSSNPSVVICADCNKGEAVWNCVDYDNFSCDCKICKPNEKVEEVVSLIKEGKFQEAAEITESCPIEDRPALFFGAGARELQETHMEDFLEYSDYCWKISCELDKPD
jgi:hypothetical protein